MSKTTCASCMYLQLARASRICNKAGSITLGRRAFTRTMETFNNSSHISHYAFASWWVIKVPIFVEYLSTFLLRRIVFTFGIQRRVSGRGQRLPRWWTFKRIDCSGTVLYFVKCKFGHTWISWKTLIVYVKSHAGKFGEYNLLSSVVFNPISYLCENLHQRLLWWSRHQQMSAEFEEVHKTQGNYSFVSTTPREKHFYPNA